MLNWVGMRSCDGSNVNKFVMLLMEHLIQWKVPVLAVEQPMHEMENHVFSDDHEEDLLAHLPAVGNVFWQD